MECLDANLVQDLMSGTLDASTRTAVIEHLDTCTDCRQLVAITARTTVHEPLAATVTTNFVANEIALATTISPSSAAAEAPAPGRKIGKYLLIERLGAGAIGVVWRAEDPELGRRIALKVLKRPDATLTERLLREAQSMAQVNHPNVVTVYEAGSSDGVAYIAMELVTGRSLRAWQRSARHTVPEIVEAYITAGRGLAAAHGAGIVHRDFKPDNVLVSDDGRICVTDFGLAAAKPTSAITPRISDVELTTSGSVLGTPAYMAPEQFVGGNLDPRTDQFNFCSSLYEALYGERPFAGTTFDQLGRDVCDGKIRSAPAGTRVSGALRAIVLRGLAVKPGDRFPTMDQLLRELGRDRARPWRRVAIAASALAAALALGVVTDWVVRGRVELGVRQSFALTGRQIDRAAAHLTGQFRALSSQVYVMPVMRDVSGHHDQADFELGSPEADAADLEQLRALLTATDWRFARELDEPGQLAVIAVADYKGRLLFTTAAPNQPIQDLMRLPFVRSAFASGSGNTATLLAYDDPALVSTKLLGASPRDGIGLVLMRTLTLTETVSSAFIQVLDGASVLDGIRLGDETRLALVAPGGRSFGDLPAELVTKAPPDGAVARVGYHGRTYELQSVPLRAFDGRIVMAMPVDTLLLSLFPGARFVFPVASLLAIGLAIATALRARQIARARV
jgi:predicted Ser/Thr protein kinase